MGGAVWGEQMAGAAGCSPSGREAKLEPIAFSQTSESRREKQTGMRNSALLEAVGVRGWSHLGATTRTQVVEMKATAAFIRLCGDSFL